MEILFLSFVPIYGRQRQEKLANSMMIRFSDEPMRTYLQQAHLTRVEAVYSG